MITSADGVYHLEALALRFLRRLEKLVVVACEDQIIDVECCKIYVFSVSLGVDAAIGDANLNPISSMTLSMV